MSGKYRKAVFMVVYSREKNKISYLILKRKLHWRGWEFPKGGVEKRESYKDAVKREIKEETGQRIFKIKPFNVSGKYNYDKKYKDRPGYRGQTYRLFSVLVKRGKIKLDNLEHNSHKWVSFSEAMKKLRWTNQKRCLKMVNDFLLRK